MGFTNDHPLPLVDTGVSSNAFAVGLGGGPDDRVAAGIRLADDS